MKKDPWIEAIKQLHENRDASILCPNCELEDLQVEDLESALDQSVFERLLECPGCGASVAARIAKDATNFRPTGRSSDSADFAQRAYNRFFKKQ